MISDREQWHGFFPIPIFMTDLPEAATLNAELLALVRKMSRTEPGVRMTNEGGWHSDKTLQDRPEPIVRRYLDHARQALSHWAERSFEVSRPLDPSSWVIELWANLNRKGHSNRAHDHFRTGVIASCIYYVQTGGAHSGGHTVFLNQQSVPEFVDLGVPWRDREFDVPPQDGRLVIFPSWLGHRVNPYEGDGDRVTLALNAGHPALSVKRVGDRPLPQALRPLRALLRSRRPA